MTLLALLRHGPTPWNKARRLQGRADIPLADETRAELAKRRLPDSVDGFHALTSPLQRCRETARLLGLNATLEARLIEMDWGKFESQSLTDLRAKLGQDLLEQEAMGIDFRPPGGESPRDVQMRVASLLAEIAQSGQPTIAVTHRGVIRAIYARATGWDMKADAAHELDLYALQMFRLQEDGTPEIVALNMALPLR